MNKLEAIEQINALSTLNGVSGFEDDVARFVINKWKTLGNVTSDSMKNVYLFPRQYDQKKLTIQLDAHSDEVGFIVQAIQPNGLLTFLPVGGWVPSNIAAQKVRIKTNKGDYVTGVVTSKPPHFLSEAERKQGVTFSSLSIDIGAKNADDVETVFGIGIGSPVTPDVTCSYNEQTKLFLGKAFDCRIGVACMMDVLDELENKELPVNVIGTLTSQEEVGLRGAQVAVKKVKPDVAIVFEGCPADDTGQADYMIQSAIGKGPMLRYFDVSMITNPELQQLAIDTAQKHRIPLQVSVRSGGGTNGAPINLYEGTPVIVVGIPVRYAHTSHCYVSYDDYAAAKELVLTMLTEMTIEQMNQLITPLDY